MARKRESGSLTGRSGGAKAGFLDEESRRGRLDNGAEVMPRPRFAQIDNGTHNAENSGGLKIGVGYDPTKARLKSGNIETDLHGGLF